tara:strand:- start:136 stop:255 length:120 start_codon:yes stop_codon:yes gene_type:complete
MKPLKTLGTILLFLLAVATGIIVMAALLIGLSRMLLPWL